MSQNRTSDSSLTGSGDAGTAADGLLSIMKERGGLRDLVLLSITPVLLLVIYALPAALKWRYTIDYGNPTLLTAFASHFIHLSPSHLTFNLLGYLLVVGTLYLMALIVDRRGQFFAVSLVYLFVFPFLISWMNLIWTWSYIGLGFSGILMAFVGYLPILLFRFARIKLNLPVNELMSLWIFCLALAIAAFIALPRSYTMIFALLAILSTGVFVWLARTQFPTSNLDSIKASLTQAGNLEFVILSGMVFLFYPFLAFSSNLLVGGNVLNIYTHGLGLCFGFAVPYVTYVRPALRGLSGHTRAR